MASAYEASGPVRFADDIRTRFPKHREGLDELESLFMKYEERYPRRYISKGTARRQLGHHAANLLLTSLSRARLLTATTIHCVNGGLAPGMYLSTRAHWEMAGLAAHVLIALRRLYAGESSEAEIESTLRRLALGRRWEIPTDMGEDVSAINALTLVGSAAKLLKQDDVEKYVRDCYDFLSEHCHPNLFGRLAGVTIVEGTGRIEFAAAFTISSLDISTCFRMGLPSHGIFIYAYDECFRLLNEHEEMPTIEW